jgi:PRTRC genetic system protein A
MNGQEITMKFDQLLELQRAAFEQFVAATDAALRTQRPMPIALDEENIDPDKLQLDLAQFAAAPVAAVPRHSEFFPLQDSGHRFLLAADGLYLEVRRPWLHVIRRLAEQKAVAMPYGHIEPRTDLAFGRLGDALGLFRTFAEHARSQAPNETACALAWDAELKELLYVSVTVQDSTPSSLRYELPALRVDGPLSYAFDLHSHGQLPAFFSDTDNRDDAGSVKIAGVFGNLDQPVPTVAFRLCVLGLYIPINVPAEKIFG